MTNRGVTSTGSANPARTIPVRKVGDERGAGTALIAVVVLGLCMVLATGLMALGWMSSRRHAGRVADLSVLAGAHALVRGEDACGRAAQVALRNGGRVVDCRAEGAPPSFVVWATVRVELAPAVRGGPRTVEVTSWAGSGTG